MSNKNVSTCIHFYLLLIVEEVQKLEKPFSTSIKFETL